jgi:eukaryotic-like serine/threonine-protein kinase
LEVVRRIGAGGMAETLECHRTSPGGLTARVCVKRMLPSHREDPELVRLFEREARLSLQLNHGSIARAIETLVDAEGPALVLEYVDGIDLRKLLTSRRESGDRLDVDLVLLILKDMGLALHHAHTLVTDEIPSGLVHRDISPSNILLGTDGDVKLVDFGIAKAVGDSHRTTTGVIRGKIPYMAPEYARTGHYDTRSDLFSLGVVGYELLTLRRPYQGQNDPETLEHAALGKRTPLELLRSDTPAALGRLIEALISPNPEERPPSARAVLEAMEGLGGRIASRISLARAVQSLTDRPGAESLEAPTRALETLEDDERTVLLDEPTAPPETEPLPSVAETRALAPQPHEAPRRGAPRSLVIVVLAGIALAVGTWLALTLS